MSTRKTLHCSVITPERQVFAGEVDSVILPAHDGLIGVLKDRAPLLCEVGIGILTLSGATSGTKTYFVDGGFAQVLDNEVTILTPRALAASEINVGAANQALAAAQQMSTTDDASFEARQRAIARAQAQLKMVA